MIAEKSIQEVRDVAQIEEVVGEFIKLNRGGFGNCPFHNEKSASFKVSPQKNIYKCFGCGAAGDAIKFIQEHENKTFYEAIQWLADKYRITLDHDKEEPNAPKKDPEENRLLYEVIRAANKNYVAQLFTLPAHHPAIADMHYARLLDRETLLEWQIGFAPDDWRFLVDKVIKADRWNQAEKLGLVKHNEEKGKNFDFFRNRIMIPILDVEGRVIAFGGRTVDPNEKQKYYNSPENPLYRKDKTLFGLYQALRKTIQGEEKNAVSAIKREGFAYLVEGYFDVIQMHRRGIENTVAPCGTALTAGQIKTLKRYTENVVLLYDGDSAGINAALKNLDICLSVGMNVYIVALPKGEDPDSFCRCKETIEIQNFLSQNRQDAFVFKADFLLKQAGEDISDKTKAIQKISQTAINISNEVKRGEYVKLIVKKFKLDNKVIAGEIKRLLEEKQEREREGEEDFYGILPKGVDLNEFMRYGFYEWLERDKTGYYYAKGRDGVEHVGNFVLKPLFHIYSKENNKRMVEINNGFHREILEMPSRTLISVEQFASAVIEEGNFIWDGTKIHLMKLLRKIADQFPKCFELKTLGWQPEGFFAFSDVIYSEGEVKKFDEMGITQHKEINYFSPSVSTIYKNVRKDDDEYENDRYLVYRPSDVDFNGWMQMFHRVYGKKGMLGIAGVIMALYKDVVFKLDNNCPLLYAYGKKGSGKSKFAESLTSVFLNNMEPFNLNHGTEFAFFNRMARFRNCITWFDELDDKTIKDERHQSLKGSYDGSGRERGKGGSRNRTEISRSNGVNLLSGQYLSTKDDNALLSRCIVLPFQEENRSAEDVKAYEELKRLEKLGLSGIITEVLKYRETFEKSYNQTFAESFSELREMVQRDGSRYEERVLRNYTVMVSCIKLFKDVVIFPFSLRDFMEHCRNEVVKLSRLIAESDSLANFWSTMEFLADREELEYGWDYKIEVRNDISVYSDGKTKNITFQRPTKVLYIRLANVQKAVARYNFKDALDESTLRLYFEPLASYIGNNKGSNFKGKNASKNSSAYVFDYEKLGVNLERTKDDEPAGKLITLNGVVSNVPKTTSLMGKELLEFSLRTDNSYKNDMGITVTNDVYVKCQSELTDFYDKIFQNTELEVTGWLVESEYTKDNEKRISRVMRVQEMQILETEDAPLAEKQVPIEDEDMPF